MPILPHARHDPAQAAHRLPAARRRAVRRGADGARGVLGHLVAALPHPSADDGEVGAPAARDRVGGRRRHLAPAPALPHRRACTQRRQRRRSTGSRCCSTATSRCCTSSPTRTTRTSTATRRRTRWCTSSKGSGVLETVFGDLPYQRRATTSSSTANITHRWRLDLAAGPTKLLVIESRGHVRCPEALPQRVRPAARGRAVLASATSAARRELGPHDETGDFPILVKQYDATQRARARSPSVRRGRAGTATSIRGPSTSTTSSRSSAASTSRRRCTRRSRATAS